MLKHEVFILQLRFPRPRHSPVPTSRFQAKVQTMYNRANCSVLRYWQKRATRPIPEDDDEPPPPIRLPGVNETQIPGDEPDLAHTNKVNSRKSNLYLGFDTTGPDYADDEDIVTVNEPSRYRGRPKSGRQWA